MAGFFDQLARVLGWKSSRSGGGPPYRIAAGGVGHAGAAAAAAAADVEAGEAFQPGALAGGVDHA